MDKNKRSEKNDFCFEGLSEDVDDILGGLFFSDATDQKLPIKKDAATKDILRDLEESGIDKELPDLFQATQAINSLSPQISEKLDILEDVPAVSIVAGLVNDSGNNLAACRVKRLLDQCLTRIFPYYGKDSMSEYKETCTRFIETIYRFVMPENYSLLQTDTLVETQYASGVWTGEVFQNVHRLLHQYVYYDQELAQLLQSYHQEYLTRIFDNCDPDSLKFIAGQVKNASPKTLNPLRDNIVGTLTLLATDAFMTYLLNIENLEVLLGLIHSSDEDIQGLIAHFLEETIDIFISDRDLMMEIAYPERDSEARSKVFSTLMSRMLKMAQENIVFVESDS